MFARTAMLLFLLISFSIDSPEVRSNTEEVCSELWRYDEFLGWRNTENCRGKVPQMMDFPSFYVQINSQGFRDEIDWTESEMERWSKSGKKKVVLLGDSVCFGFGINFRQTAGEILERILGEKFVVLNMSVVGYSTDQETLLLEREGVKYSPDYVVYCMWVNDIAGVLDSKPIESRRGKPVFMLEENGLKLMNVPVSSISLFPERYREMFQLIYGRYVIDMLDKKIPSKIELAVDLLLRKIKSKFTWLFHRQIIRYTTSLIAEIIRRGKKTCSSCEIVVLLIPDYLQVKGLNPYADAIYKILEKKIDFAEIEKVELKENQFFTKNFHPNEKGHSKIAEILANIIKEIEDKKIKKK